MTEEAFERIRAHFWRGFREAEASRHNGGLRLGSELKFPFVSRTGEAVRREVVDALWRYLVSAGWTADVEGPDDLIVGARTPGERNDTVASCETGYCKPEFSLAHVGDLDALKQGIGSLVKLLRPFLDANGAEMLCYGIQPVSAPGADLLMKKMRASFWDKAFPSNKVVPPERGDDAHMFTVNASSHVHVSVPLGDAVKAVNVLNGLAGGQIALTADSGPAGDWVQPGYHSIDEKLWDWWEAASGRVGVPEKPFEDFDDYVRSIAALPPVFVKRDGEPLLLGALHGSLTDYFEATPARAVRLNGSEVDVEPREEDIDVHNSCYWYTARISRYYTVENRVCDQQPADALTAPAAMTLGLVSNLDEAWEEVASHDWASLRRARRQACDHGLTAVDGSDMPAVLAARLLDLAERGLKNRAEGEETYLQPLRERLTAGRTPADEARGDCGRLGMEGFVEARRLTCEDVGV